MKPSPCLHPIRVFNKSLNSWTYVPCGHCDACLCGKGFHLSERLGNSVALYRHKYFVTLTFDDAHLPVARYDDSLGCFVHPCDCDYNGVVYSCSCLEVERSLSDKDFKSMFEKYNGIPVLSRRLLINFKKRLRKNFSKYYGKEYLFIYGVGEYGPTHYRPHYHLLLCTNAPVKSSVLELCVSQAWSDYDKVEKRFVCQYGKIDFQTVISKGARNYVAQYLSCVTNLPVCLSRGSFRPFYQSSPLIDSECLRYEGSDLCSFFAKCSPVASVRSLLDNSRCELCYPKGIVNRFFPKCFKFGELSFWDRVSFYSVFERVNVKSAKEFADFIIHGWFGLDSFGLCKQLLVDTDLYASTQRLIRHYYLSRRVVCNARLLNVSLHEYVSRIDLFWSRYELFKLKNFYEMQVSLLDDVVNPVSVSDLFGLYYDTSDTIKHLSYYINQFFNPTFSNQVSFIPLQCNYSRLMRKIILDTTKTKKRNGYFEANGLVRPSFINRLKHKKSCQAFFQI